MQWHFKLWHMRFGNSRGGGRGFNFKGMYAAKLEFPEGWEVQRNLLLEAEGYGHFLDHNALGFRYF